MGILIAVTAMMLGCICGTLLKQRMNDRICNSLLDVFGFGAITIGIININKADNLSLIILALVIGAFIGEIIDIESKVCKNMDLLIKSFRINLSEIDTNQREKFLSAAIVFCISGSGIFGAILEGVNGDSSILISKAILDFFTALIFAVSLGKVISLIVIPETLILLIFFCMGRIIMPYLDDSAIANFMATGGIITLMAGVNIFGIKKISVINSIPALLLVFVFGVFM